MYLWCCPLNLCVTRVSPVWSVHGILWNACTVDNIYGSSTWRTGSILTLLQFDPWRWLEKHRDFHRSPRSALRVPLARSSKSCRSAVTPSVTFGFTVSCRSTQSIWAVQGAKRAARLPASTGLTWRGWESEHIVVWGASKSPCFTVLHVNQTHCKYVKTKRMFTWFGVRRKAS